MPVFRDQLLRRLEELSDEELFELAEKLLGAEAARKLRDEAPVGSFRDVVLGELEAAGRLRDVRRAMSKAAAPTFHRPRRAGRGRGPASADRPMRGPARGRDEATLGPEPEPASGDEPLAAADDEREEASPPRERSFNADIEGFDGAHRDHLVADRAQWIRCWIGQPSAEAASTGFNEGAVAFENGAALLDVHCVFVKGSDTPGQHAVLTLPQSRRLESNHLRFLVEPQGGRGRRQDLGVPARSSAPLLASVDSGGVGEDAVRQ